MLRLRPTHAVAPVLMAAALSSHASGGIVINMFDDGNDIRANVTGSFDFFNANEGTSSNSVSVNQINSTKVDFRTAGVGTRESFTVTPQFTGNFGGSTLSSGSVVSGSLPFTVTYFSTIDTWKVFADPSLATTASYNWEVVFSNTSIAAKGFNVGTYVWTWTNGTDTDSITLNIGASTPAVPGVGALAALGGVGLAGRRRRR